MAAIARPPQHRLPRPRFAGTPSRMLALVLAWTALPLHADPSPLPDSPAEQRVVASPQDRSFLNDFIAASLAATEAGQMAMQRASLAAVRELGGQLQAAFMAARRQLAGLTSALPLPPLPEAPAPGQLAGLERLRQAPDSRFDHLYLLQQLDAQDGLLRLLEIESGTGDNPAIKAFATSHLAQLHALRQQTQALATSLPPSPAAGLTGD